MHRTWHNGVNSIDYTGKTIEAGPSCEWSTTFLGPSTHLGPTTVPLPGATQSADVASSENCRKIPLVSEPLPGERRLTAGDEEVPEPTEDADEDEQHPPGPETDIFDVSRVHKELAVCGMDARRKPSLSYIALISLAILESPTQQLILADIYEWIQSKFPYYRHTEAPSWRNSIRHNLSLNECFVKKGRCERGKCCYWTIHPANVDDFRRYDFRRRHARRRVRMCSSERIEERVRIRNMNMWTSHKNNYVPMEGVLVSTSRLVAMFGAKAVLSSEELDMDANGETAMCRADELSAYQQLHLPHRSNAMSLSNSTYDLHNFESPVARPGNRYHRYQVMPICPVPGEFSPAAMAAVTSLSARYDGQDGVSLSDVAPMPSL